MTTQTPDNTSANASIDSAINNNQMAQTHAISWYKPLLWVSLFNSLMALVAWQTAIAPDVSSAISVSCTLGYSILVANLIAKRSCQQWLPAPVYQSLATVCGLLIGLMLAGLLVTNNLWHFFSINSPTLYISAMAAFFASALTLFSLRLAASKHQLQQSQIHNLRQQKHISEARLQVLQAQIEPHFLFNTLATIIGMIDKQPQQAKDTLQHLTSLLRASLSTLRQPLHLLSEELALVHAYLEIQSKRMGKRLSYTINNQYTEENQQILPLLLQPIVENAITHGLETQTQGGHIDIDINKDQHFLHILIRDNGKGIEQQTTPNIEDGTYSISLNNIQQRLETYYGKSAAMTIEPHHPSGVCVRLQLPLVIAATKKTME